MKYILILMADGCEEIEALAPVDVLRRAHMNVQTVACSGSSGIITGSHNIAITCDQLVNDALKKIESGILPDAVVCPGGMIGSQNLAKNSVVTKILLAMHKAHKIIAANCAAPVIVFAKLGLLKKKNYTCYPGMQNNFEQYAPNADVGMSDAGIYKDAPAVVDGNMLTGHGPGASFVFSLKLLELLSDRQTAEKLKDGMVIMEGLV
ncbi:MAG: hypothetical protein BKP49_03110 [Treponema sp. CETP13]|nr:MAG: hypothetical protein BKP49_03110 [Treponema sp. CETP13]